MIYELAFYLKEDVRESKKLLLNLSLGVLAEVSFNKSHLSLDLGLNLYNRAFEALFS